MIITVTNDLKNKQSLVEVKTEVNSVEQALMDAYGEPQIDITGTIPYTKANMDSDTFVISGGPVLKYVRSSMPISYQVDGNTDAEAKGKAAGWGIEMKNRLTTAMATLKTNPLLSLPDVEFFEV